MWRDLWSPGPCGLVARSRWAQQGSLGCPARPADLLLAWFVQPEATLDSACFWRGRWNVLCWVLEDHEQQARGSQGLPELCSVWPPVTHPSCPPLAGSRQPHPCLRAFALPGLVPGNLFLQILAWPFLCVGIRTSRCSATPERSHPTPHMSAHRPHSLFPVRFSSIELGLQGSLAW